MNRLRRRLVYQRYWVEQNTTSASENLTSSAQQLLTKVLDRG